MTNFTPTLPSAGLREEHCLSRPGRLACLLLGGSHHLLHLAPTAARSASDGRVRVDFLVTSDEEAALARSTLDMLGGAKVRVERLRVPRPIAAMPKFRKIATLAAHARRLATYDALLVVDRTSTFLKRLPGSKPFMVHIPHGAGDRARGFEKRIRRFDHVIVAGAKDRRRMISSALVDPRHCSISGYLKAAAVRRFETPVRRLFDNDRQTIIYNPHFDRRLSSWRDYGPRLVDALRDHGRFNVIVAPHCRMFAGAPKAAREAALKLSVPGKVHVDLGSDRSNDMSYTRAADIYLGDVSSQVYEFLADGPRPCVFLAADGVSWRGNEDFAHWRYGDVCERFEDVLRTIDSAVGRHHRYRAAQTEGVLDALGSAEADPIAAAATILCDLIEDRKMIGIAC